MARRVLAAARCRRQDAGAASRLRISQRRGFLFALVLLAVAIIPSVGAAIGDSASGSGTSTQNGGSSFNYSVVGGPGSAGGGASGTMTYNQVQGAHTITADARCLFVSGNRATAVGLITASTVPPPAVGSVGNHMIFFAEDNGSPGAGQDRWIAFFGGASETSCTDFFLGPPILTGEIVVGDATTPAPPTSKQQCKKGGWRKFTNPSFKNQGQCVKFVNHHNGQSKDDEKDHSKTKSHGKKK